jgi:hypothetical protein
MCFHSNKGNNKITELRTILQMNTKTIKGAEIPRIFD